MKKRVLGNNGPEVSAVGLGCMGMSEFYGSTDDENSKKVILSALENGVTLLDTADCYGDGHNERLIAEALKEWGGDVFIATKFGIVREPGVYERKICGKPDYVKEAVETVLKAHAVHPVTCVQSEYSLFTRDVEESLLPVLRKNGIGFVPYSPLGRGMLTGKLTKETMDDEKDLRNVLPRTSGTYFDDNMVLVNKLKEIADSRSITLSQLALAWVLSRGDDMVPIPGTRNIRYLMDNIQSAAVRRGKDEIRRIESIVCPGAVKGERYTMEGMKGVNC